MTLDRAIDLALEAAREKGLQAEISAVEATSTAIGFQSRKLDQYSVSESRQLGVRVVNGRHEGVAYSESLDPESLIEMIEEAAANAKMIQKELDLELQGEIETPKLSDIYNPGLESVPTDKKIQFAEELEATALDTDQRIISVPYCRYTDRRVSRTIANTRGFRAQYQTNGCTTYVACLANDNEGSVMAWDVSFSRDFNALDAKKLAKSAAEKTLERLGARRPSNGKYTIVFENRVAEEFLSLMSSYFSGKSVYEKTSPLADKKGQKIFADVLTVVDDPFLAQGQSSRPFDDEGYASKKTTLVENGRLMGFLTNSVYARLMKEPHTAHGSRSPSTDLSVSPSNLVVTPGQRPLADLLAADKNVILITDLLGRAGFRAASGDFSLPVEGLMYVDGRMDHALKDFLISGNILDLFKRVEAVGNDSLVPVSDCVSPSLLIRDVNVAGKA